MEDVVPEAKIRKSLRYLDLIDACKVSGYQAELTTVEIGSRGWVAHSLSTLFQKLGVSRTEIKGLKQRCSSTALRCSYFIFVSRSNKTWIPFQPFLAAPPTNQQ